jgi:hypothetical protein
MMKRNLIFGGSNSNSVGSAMLGQDFTSKYSNKSPGALPILVMSASVCMTNEFELAGALDCITSDSNKKLKRTNEAAVTIQKDANKARIRQCAREHKAGTIS